ncbi:MAG: NADH-quinone oxidoreductase subunit NuoK [Bdellovibrionota bacterium]
MPVLTDYLCLSAALFCLGVYGVITRRNTVAVLMAVELILNAASLNFVAFSHYVTESATGQVFALFVILMAGAEAAVGLALVLVIYHNFRSINVDEVATLHN